MMRFLLIAMFVVASVTADAQDAEFQILDATGIPGADITVVIELDTDGSLEDYQFGVCNDELVSVSEVNFGRRATSSGLTFEFHVVDISDDGFTVEAIIDDTYDLDALGFTLYDVIYTMGDELGTSDLEFCETLLTMEATVDGEEITPTGTGGSVEIVEPGPEFLRGDANGDGFVNHILDSYHILHWSYNDGPEPGCSDAADVDNDGTLFPLFDAVILMLSRFGSAGDTVPPPGVEECGSDPEGGDLGCDEAATCPGTDNPLDQEANADYELVISSEVGFPDSLQELTVELSNDGDGLGAFQFSLCFDEDQVEIEDGNAVYGDDLESWAEEATYRIITIDDGRIDFVFWSVPSSSNLDPLLEAGEDIELFRLFFDVDADALGFVPIEFCAGDSTLSPLLVTESADGVVPTLTPGGIDVVEGVPFVRGDVDGDGAINGILDALALLVWGFQNGDTPGCMDATDADDSGAAVPILDALYILEYVFVGGDLPPDPGPSECGVDPTDDDLDCETPSDGCA